MCIYLESDSFLEVERNEELDGPKSNQDPEDPLQDVRLPYLLSLLENAAAAVVSLTSSSLSSYLHWKSNRKQSMTIFNNKYKMKKLHNGRRGCCPATR